MSRILLIGVLVLTGCNAAREPEWNMAPQIYNCTEEQMRRVEAETRFCDENTDFIARACYGHAIIRHCTFNEERAARIAPWLLAEAKQ